MSQNKRFLLFHIFSDIFLCSYFYKNSVVFKGELVGWLCLRCAGCRSRAFPLLLGSYFPPETTTSLSLAANHLVEVGHRQELALRGGHRARFNWDHMAGKGDGGVWAGAGQRVGDAPSPCLADQGLGESGKEWERVVQPRSGLGEKPRHPQSILIPHQ